MPEEATDPLPGLTEGRIVHFVLGDGPSAGQHRPAIVVRVWNPKATELSSRGTIQLQVFTDGSNDGLQNVEWRTSVGYSEDPQPYTWHWPERA
jgi:hypothetical protein